MLSKQALFSSCVLEAVEDKFEEDSTATIACPVYTVPGATVTWHKQGGDLPENAEQKQNLLMYEERG